MRTRSAVLRRHLNRAVRLRQAADRRLKRHREFWRLTGRCPLWNASKFDSAPALPAISQVHLQMYRHESASRTHDYPGRILEFIHVYSCNVMSLLICMFHSADGGNDILTIASAFDLADGALLGSPSPPQGSSDGFRTHRCVVLSRYPERGYRYITLRAAKTHGFLDMGISTNSRVFP